MQDDNCTAEFIDGHWTRCGCLNCRELEADLIERAVEMDAITLQHELNGSDG
ncbi:hypothetical protein [Streptosporangium sp. CA-115845]|uniref:hypothetical protein n=1 Tax=Streptosporangium sp. CA-115845 TaxID=3240071 RepID=UPI003D8FF982